MEITESLMKEFESELVEISNIEVGSKEHTAAVESATKLADRIIEINKFESEREDKRALVEEEHRLKAEEIEVTKKGNLLRNGVAIGTTVVTLLAYWATYNKTMKYESEGIIPTTEPGRNANKSLFNLNRLLKF